jgi:hypothetical protein
MQHLSQTQRRRNARPSPQERTRICEAISIELALEYFRRTNAKREAWARIAIGLPPTPRQNVNREVRS